MNSSNIDYELCCSYLIQAFMLVKEYQWMASSYIAVSEQYRSY